MNRKEKIHFRIRSKNKQNLLRLSVFASKKHIYAQVIDDQLGKTILSERSMNNEKGYNVAGALIVAKRLGEKFKEHGIKEFVFDRGEMAYHGRIKALREGVMKYVEGL